MSWRGPAGLDRRRRHRDRSSDSSIHPKLQSLLDGSVGMELDALLALLGVAPLFVGGRGAAEVVCAMLGVIVVLVVGSIWRRRSLHRIEQGM
jgi:hypothetical protein